MSTEQQVHDSIERAAESVGQVWPLHSFVTANPLSGLEYLPFPEAVERGETLYGGQGYPAAHVFERAWDEGRIDTDLLRDELAEHGYDETPSESLDRLAEQATDDGNPSNDTSPAEERVNKQLTKWLARFLDQGNAAWPLPEREQGFYRAVRSVARHDRDLPDPQRFASFPAEPVAALDELLAGYPVGRWPDIFEYHLTALPGWTGLIKQRIADDDEWQSAYPITLAGYLAVRLALTDMFDAPVEPDSQEATTSTVDSPDEGAVPRAECWLSAWESTYRSELVEALADPGTDDTGSDDRPAAQLTFCIDTRSEVIRRHIEAQGDYETHGYAGFFGVPMEYSGYDSEVSVDACPPILDTQHRIEEQLACDHDHEQERFDHATGLRHTAHELVENLQSNAATAFNFVESTGPGYALALVARTLAPERVYDLLDRTDRAVPDTHEFCEPTSVGDDVELTVDRKVEYAANAFELMGIEQFARIVAFVGHGSQTANNPFDSSLDCGACAGNPGGPNARVLARICNDDRVRQRLRERGIDVPEDTVFVAGEHNTTTDDVTLFTQGVPESHQDDIDSLQTALDAARDGAAAERAEAMGEHEEAGPRETERRAADWAETRPEWGLAGNAGFVVGPRELTADLDLDGRAFLHSYDWRTDDDGSALEAIMTGPMVVTQWINSQYYFATTDNAVYGSGSKVTQNPVGNVGVYQGNGGALATGLPLQSVMATDEVPYHQPLRLSVVIHAPVERAMSVLVDHGELRTLLENGWLSLTVVDPQRDHRPFQYEGELQWDPLFDETPARVAEKPVEQPVTDD